MSRVSKFSYRRIPPKLYVPATTSTTPLRTLDRTVPWHRRPAHGRTTPSHKSQATIDRTQSHKSRVTLHGAQVTRQTSQVTRRCTWPASSPQVCRWRTCFALEALVSFEVRPSPAPMVCAGRKHSTKKHHCSHRAQVRAWPQQSFNSRYHVTHTVQQLLYR